MTAPSALGRINDGLSEFWNARSQRERKQLLLALAVLALGLVYMLLIEPAFVGREQLKKNLPTLRLQASEMQALASQASALAQETPPPPPDMTKESIESAITRSGMSAQNVAMAGTGLAKVQPSGVSSANMIVWLNEMQKTARVTVAEASIKAQQQPDTVDATLTLRQQKSE